MNDVVRIKKGLDIKMDGEAIRKISKVEPTKVIEINPSHYHDVIPKMVVKGGERVKVGSPLFYHKNYPEMNFVSPVSGTVSEVVRGERRKVLAIRIAVDDSKECVDFDVKNGAELSSEEVKALLLKSGLWTLIRQRPYDVIANPTKMPKAIFISTFDSAPLAPDYEFVMKDKMADFQLGVDVLGKLTQGKVYLGVKSEDSIFSSVKNGEITVFQGKHPAGNVGVQINHLNPINKGETVWTVQPQDVAMIGRFFNQGVLDMSRVVALTGPEVATPQYVETVVGNGVEDILKGNLKASEQRQRIISGNVLTGTQIDEKGCLTPYANQITVIREGDEIHELFGWIRPRIHKFSNSYMVLSKFLRPKSFEYDTRLLGGRRAIIMSGEWDRVFPMDIYPEQLIKAMIARNIDKMECLGAYEVAPEDFALCEFVDTSKLDLQQIVRDALDALKAEVE